MMDNRFLIGAGAAAGTSIIWDRIPGHEAFVVTVKSMTSPTGEPEKSPLAFLEHYHYGMASILAGRMLPEYAPYLYGFGAGLIGSEIFQDHPFGIGKTPQEERGNLAMAILLGSLLVMTYGSG